MLQYTIFGVVLACATSQVLAAGFRVSGTRILDAQGQPFIMRGANIPYTWFKSDLTRVVQAVASTRANIVRVVLGDGGQYPQDSPASVQAVLNACKQFHLVAMLEVHDTTGSNDVKTLTKAANFWVSLAPILKGLEDRVIINIANEWTAWGQVNTWSLGYRAVIPKLRNAGLTHLLAVDASGYGQDISSLALQGKAVFNADRLRNTMFGVHLYEVNGANDATVERTIATSLAVGVPFAITEFSDSQGGKPVAYAKMMSLCRTLGIGWIAWSWFGNGLATSNMDMSRGPNGGLTVLGTRLVDGTDGIRKTAKAPSIKW